MIQIPLETPTGRKVNTIGIWMSGGTDSSLLTYLIAKTIIDNNLPVNIYALTVDYKRPFQGIAKEVREKITELLGKNVFVEHDFYYPPADRNFTAEELREEFHLQNYKNFKNNKFQILFSGITTNPPLDIQQSFKWGVLNDVEVKRGADVPKTTRRYFTRLEDGKEYEFYEIKPFFELNKKDIASIYKKHNLMQSLFPLTRSCEDLTTVRGHCGKCWWCEERHWGFNTL